MEQFCQDNVKIAIVGGGPAGIYCALNILLDFKNHNFKNYEIVIFDKSQILRTILPTGGSRCNITNAISDIDEYVLNYPRGGKFLRSLFFQHFNVDSIEFFKSIGIKTYIQDDNRVFPISNSSKDVKDKMLEALKKFSNVKMIHKEIISKDELSNFDKIIISCGSRKVEKLIESFNQPFIPFKKALCALVVKDFKYPQGVSVSSLEGDFVFTNNGISGPLAYKISSLNIDAKFPYDIQIALFDIDRLSELIKENPKKTVGALVAQLVPKSLARIIVDKYDRKASEISKKDLLSYSILNLRIVDNSSMGEIVNAGGVDLKYIDKNCKSKITENIWFCGEVLNIDGFCGGFNLQNCWSSAYVVAKDVVGSIIE